MSDRKFIQCLAAGAILTALAGYAIATPIGGDVGSNPIVLQDLNSQITFQLPNQGTQSTDPNRDGMNSWLVDNVNQLGRQWFWYRRTDSGKPMNAEKSVSSLYLLQQVVNNTNSNPGYDRLYLRFGDQKNPGQSNYTIEITLSLTGYDPGTGLSDLHETITINNHKVKSGLSLNLYQYTDFNLNPTPDHVDITGGKSVTSNSSNSIQGIVEATGANLPTRVQAGNASSLYALFTDASSTTLNGTTSASGDVASAFEWENLYIPWNSTGPPNSVTIELDKHVYVAIPEPGALAVFGFALPLLIRPRRRKIA